MSRSILDNPSISDYQYHRTIYVSKKKHFCFKHSYYILPVLILIIFVLLVLFNTTKHKKVNPIPSPSTTACDFQLVETLPESLNYSADNLTKFNSTYGAWKWLLDNAKNIIEISSLHCNIQSATEDNLKGNYLYKRFLANRFMSPKLKLRIVQHKFHNDVNTNNDTLILRKSKAADVSYIDFQKYFNGTGLLHTKLWIVDERHFYIGSADMDWRSLSQTKELGVLVKNCPQLAMDVGKIFKAYWYLGSNPKANFPDEWPKEYSTHYNASNPMVITLNSNNTMKAYFSSSPPPLSAIGRTHDLDAILNGIDTANSYINIAIMDYYPLMIYTKTIKYWPYIDGALRRAAIERKVSIKLLISWWTNSNPLEDYFLRSLQDLSQMFTFVDFEVRRFVIPGGAVSHNKYFVTENIAYIGTSNWSGDFFTNNAGIGLVLSDLNQKENVNTFRLDLLKVFQRDWDSPYALILKRQDMF